MAITKNPKRILNASTETAAEAFISGTPATEIRNRSKRPIMVRIDSDILDRVDRAAKRLGISRSAYIVSSAAERLERTDQG